MIRWCAYCQRFLSETTPFDDYRITHTICRTCSRRMGDARSADLEELAGIIDFFRRLESIALGGTPADVEKILQESRELGIRPIDLMMGMLQPLLARVGSLWAAGLVAVATEHRFSALAGDLLAHIRAGSPAGKAQPEAPELLLVNAEGNYHTLGLQMAELYFAIRGIPTLAIVPGLPTEEVMGLLETHEPRAVGFSVAIPPQLKQVREVRERLKALPHPPQRLLVGGPAVRLGLNPDPSFRIDVCRKLSEAAILLSGSSLIGTDPDGEDADYS